MNNEPMYNTFVKERRHDDKRAGNPNSKHRHSRVTENDIPDIDFDVEEPGDLGASFGQGNAVGVDRSLGNFSEYRRHDDEFDQPYPDSQAARSERSPYTEPFEFEDGCITLPNPEIFNSYPPEVQRKIMEWTDRDIKARRDDASHRQDAILRAEIARNRSKMAIPVAIIILSIVCALITGLYTKRFALVVGFLVVAVVVVITTAVGKYQQSKRGFPKSPHGNL